MQEPPRPGSPLEALCMYVFNARQRAEFLKTVLTAPPVTSEKQKENYTNILNEYVKEVFPYQEELKWKNTEKISQILDKELQKGPLVVQAEALKK
tara:strand:- start:878 stop:1162 length:285 start_codon:yes stop_codon:yes gene_type:complete